MEGLSLCGNCRINRDDVVPRDPCRLQSPESSDENAFWRPLRWCPDEPDTTGTQRPAKGPETWQQLESAAVRIQAHFRGQRSRVTTRVRFLDPNASDCAADSCSLRPATAAEVGLRKCPQGHMLVARELPTGTQPQACESCRRSFVANAKMFNCDRCSYCVCEACWRGSPCLLPGHRVQLCGMNNNMLNCLNGVVEARSDRNRYTVLIEELGDYITLPAENLEQADEESSSEEASGSEVHDTNNPVLDMVRSKSQHFATRVSVAAKQFMDRGLLGGLEEMAGVQSLKVPLLDAWWAEKKQLAMEQLLDVSAPMRKRMLESVGEFVKDASMRDPDMWAWVRPLVKSAVKGIWDDIEVEIEGNIENALTDGRTGGDRHRAGSVTPGPTFSARFTNGCSWWFLKVRACVLYHYLPYNKTFFGKLKDPVYDFLVALTMLPFFGVRFFFFFFLLMMLLFPGPADEYQLVNFILHFKGTMFFTSGVIMLFIGAMEYTRCYLFSPEELLSCIEISGPGAHEWLCTLVLDYLGSISLVWVAWLVLPCTQKYPSHVEKLRGWKKKEEKTALYCFCCEGVLSRGGRLGGLLHYDVACFVASFCPMCFIYWSWTPDSDSFPHAWWAHAKAITYWCRVLYALFSLPFALFVIPVFSWLLTHSTFTGYNQHGACVEFAFAMPEETETETA